VAEVDVRVEDLGVLGELAAQLFVVSCDQRLSAVEDVVHARQSTFSIHGSPRVERGRLVLDGQFWGLSNGWSALLLTTPFAGAALFGLVSLQPGVYNALVREDSVLESLQFIAYAASTALAAATA
jgi:hypothetical protein